MTKAEKKAHELYPSIWQDDDGNIEKYRLRQAFMNGVEYALQQVNSVDLADVGETLSKQEFQAVMKRELEGFREMSIFDLSDAAGELLASSIWDDHKVIER